MYKGKLRKYSAVAMASVLEYNVRIWIGVFYIAVHSCMFYDCLEPPADYDYYFPPPSQTGMSNWTLWYRTPEQLAKYCIHNFYTSNWRSFPGAICRDVSDSTLNDIKRKIPQMIDTNPGECQRTLYLYLAYLDKTVNATKNGVFKVRITGLLKTKQLGYVLNSTFCQFWYSHMSHPFVSKAKGWSIVKTTQDKSQFSAVVFECEETEPERELRRKSTSEPPTRVSLTNEPCEKPENVLTITPVPITTSLQISEALCYKFIGTKSSAQGLQHILSTLDETNKGKDKGLIIYDGSKRGNSMKIVDNSPENVKKRVWFRDHIWVQEVAAQLSKNLNVTDLYGISRQVDLLYKYDCYMVARGKFIS